MHDCIRSCTRQSVQEGKTLTTSSVKLSRNVLYDTVRRCLNDRGWGSAGLSPNTRAGPRTGQGEISSCKTEKEQVEIRHDRDDGDDLRTT